MASQVQLANTFNDFRQAYNDAANDITLLQTANTDIQSRVGLLETSNTGIFSGTAQLYANTLQLIDIDAGNRVLISRTPGSGSGGIIDSDAELLYFTANNTLLTSNVVVDTRLTLSTLTSGRVLIAGTGGAISDDSGLTYVAATDSLSATGSITAGTWANAANQNITNTVTVGANVNVTDTVNALGHLHAGGVETWITAKGEDRDIHLIAAVDDSDGPHDIAIVNRNNNANAYGEFIAMNNAGNTDQGWISMGINATNYNQGAFAITKGDDAYILYQAPVGTTKNGDLVIGTGGNGTTNRIIFSANGFDDPANNSQITIDPGDRVHIEIDTQSTSTTTGALTVAGGIGLIGNMNVGGNVTITGSITLLGAGNTVSTDTLSVANAMLFLANGNSADSIDIGVIGEYTAGTKKYLGFVRDASDGIFKLFIDAGTRPSNTVNFSQAGLNYASVKIGDLDVANTTATSSTTTGALKVAGGVGVAGGVWVGGTIRTDSTTATTSISTGALIINGGAGVAGNTHIGGNLVVDSGTFAVNATTNRVGVGTASPNSDLEVRATAPVLRLQESTTGGDKRLELLVSAAGEARISANQSAQDLDFFLAGTRQVKFATSGNVVMYGTTSSSSTSTGALVVGGGLGVAGAVYSGSGFVESSSITLKENINPIENALDAVMRMMGVTFDRKDGSNFNEAGMIAEDLNNVAPSLVNKDKDGNPNAIYYSRVTAYLVEAIKTLKNQIDPLKEEIRKLKGE